METKSTGAKLMGWLRKNGVVSLLGLLTAGLLGVAAAQRWLLPRLTTPIATIELPDSVRSVKPVDKLTAYKAELKKAQQQELERQKALREIVAMDFSKPLQKVATPPEASPLPTADTVSSPLSFQPKPVTKKTVLRQPVRKPQESASPPAEKPAEFYTVHTGPSGENQPASPTGNASGFYLAVIHGDQKVGSNQLVRIRLKEKIPVSGQWVAVNTILHGRLRTGSLGRVSIAISTVNGKPVRLTVYDQDYLPGIAHGPEGTTAQVVEQTKNEAISDMLNAIPYAGGIAGGLTKIGKDAFRKSQRKQATVYLADGQPIWLKLEP